MTKRSIRQQMKQKRANVKDALSLACIQEKTLKILKNFNTIGLYVSFDDEINTYPLLTELLKLNKTIAVPKIINQEMKLYKLESMNDLEKGFYNIMEPKSMQEVNPECIVVPLIAFNSRKYRIGYGGGYYDRYLKDKKMVKIGMAYSFMNIEFTEDSYDVALDVIVTEK